MFKVFINDGSESLPNDDIFYIVAKDKNYIKKKTGLIEAIVPVDKISILKSFDVSSYAKINIPKIGSLDFSKIVSFFREVYKKYIGESIVLIYYNEKSKKFKFIPPKQEVSGGSLEYLVDNIPTYSLIGDIHSHGGFSAFHSGTDDLDEKFFDGIHITIGDVDDTNISISASIVVNGFRVMVDPKDYIYGISKINQDDSNNCLNYSRKDKFKVEVSERKSKFNKSWMDSVSKLKPKTTNVNDHMNQFTLFDMENYKTMNVTIPNFSVNIEDIEDMIPCNNCIYRNVKLSLEEDDLEDDILDNLPEDNPMDDIETDDLDLEFSTQMIKER